VRFSVIDVSPASVVESGIDDFRVYDILCTDACPADINADGVLNFFDITDYLTLFNDQDPAADLDQNGQFNFFDVSTYLTLYNAGCP
jgi:hypothetical protein